MPTPKKSPTRSTKKRSKKFSLNLAVYGPMTITMLVVLAIGFFAGISYSKEKPRMLFTQQALTGSFRPNTTESGTYTLNFLGVKPQTLISSDGMHRVVGSWTNADFIARWNQVSTGAPNAVLLSHDPVDGKEYSITVQLKDPAFNAFAGTLTYTATIVNTIQEDGLSPSPERHMEAFPTVLRSPALFIDGRHAK